MLEASFTCRRISLMPTAQSDVRVHWDLPLKPTLSPAHFLQEAFFIINIRPKRHRQATVPATRAAYGTCAAGVKQLRVPSLRLVPISIVIKCRQRNCHHAQAGGWRCRGIDAFPVRFDRRHRHGTPTSSTFVRPFGRASAPAHRFAVGFKRVPRYPRHHTTASKIGQTEWRVQWINAHRFSTS